MGFNDPTTDLDTITFSAQLSDIYLQTVLATQFSNRSLSRDVWHAG